MSDSVAVIIPAYNAAPYIHDCLESAFSQTSGAPDQVIVVDDGSTDGTADLVRGYGRRVTLLEQRNGGAAAARNAGASVATTDWLAFLDADDRWLPAKLEKQFARVRAGGDFVYSDRLNIGHLEGLPPVQSTLQPMFEGDVFARLLMENVITTSSVVVRRSLFQRVGGFSDDPRLPPAEDWDLWLRCADVGPIHLVAEPLVEYRLHATGASRNAHRMNRARQLIVERALQLHSARSLTAREVRHARAQMWATNGWDAGRSGAPIQAIYCYARALRYEPLSSNVYRGLLRALARS